MARRTSSNVSVEPRPPEVEPSDEDTGSRIWLYDVDGEDTPVLVSREEIPEPNDKQMLWIDVDLGSTDNLANLWNRLGISDRIDALDNAQEMPQLDQHDGLTQLNVFAVRLDPEFKAIPLHCLVSTNWIVTIHDGELDLVDDFNKPFHGETRLGALDGPAFLSMVLDWQVSGYFKVIEGLKAEIDHLDEELLQHSPDEDALLDELLALRRRVRRLRQTLAPHREVLGLLSHPDSDLVVGSETAPKYQRLLERLERALDAVDTTREMIVGSFDIFMTRTSQATNDIMKRLTLVSVLLLPSAVIAGVMGMNFKVRIFDFPWMFWATLGLMAGLAAVTLMTAKRRNWI